jgi:hypothetical protein
MRIVLLRKNIRILWEERHLLKKCPRCKNNKDLSHFRKENNKDCSSCLDCRIKSRKYAANNHCSHKKLKWQCRKCSPSAFCSHGILRSYCVPCKGGSTCSHGRVKGDCTICGGKRCSHGKRRTICPLCRGGSFCSHKVRRTRCKECSPAGYFVSIVQGHIRRALGKQKDDKSLEYLGCSIEDYLDYLEEKFEPGMNWDNYATFWEIDHIKPLMYENPTIEEVIERLHYTNTQPLEVSKNRAKGNKYIG